MYKYIYELKESKLNPIKIEFEKKEDFLKKSKIYKNVERFSLADVYDQVDYGINIFQFTEEFNDYISIYSNDTFWDYFIPDYHKIIKGRLFHEILPLIKKFHALESLKNNNTNSKTEALIKLYENGKLIKVWSQTNTLQGDFFYNCNKDLTDYYLEKEKHDTIFNNSENPIFNIDKDFHVIKINKALEDFLGYSLKEFENINYNKIVYPKEFNGNKKLTIYEILNEIFKEKILSKNVQLILISKDNSEKIVKAHLTLVNEDYVQISIFDESELVESEKNSLKIQNFLDEIQEVNKSAINLFEGDNYYWTDKIFDLLEIEPNERIYTSKNFFIKDYVNLKNQRIIDENFKELTLYHPIEFEFDIITPKGNHKYFKVYSKLVEQDDDLVRIVITQDITLEKLEKLEKLRLNASFEAVASSNKIVLAESDGNNYYFTNEIYKWLEINPEDYNGVDVIQEFAFPEDKKLLQKIWKDASEDNPFFELKFRAKSSTGKILYFEINAKFIFEEGKLITSSAFLQNITEETLSKNKALRLQESINTVSNFSKIIIGSYENGKISWTPEIYKILKINPEDYGDNVNVLRIFSSSKDLKIVDNALRNLSPENNTYSHISNVYDSEGNLHYFNSYTVANFDDNGENISHDFFIQDLTDEVLAKNEALRLQESINTIGEFSKIAIGSYENGKFTWTPEIYNILKIKPGDYDNSESLMGIFSSPKDVEEVKRLIENTKPENNSFYHLSIVYDNLGDLHYINSYTVMNFNENNEKIGDDFFIQDVTDEVLAKDEALRLQESINTLGSFSKIAIGSYENGKFTWTPEAYKILKIRRDDFDDNVNIFSEFSSDKDIKKVNNLLSNISPENNSFSYLSSVRDAEDGFHYINIYAVANFDNNEMISEDFFIQDVTDEILAKEFNVDLQASLSTIQDISKIVVCNYKEGVYNWTPEIYNILEIKPEDYDEHSDLLKDFLIETDDKYDNIIDSDFTPESDSIHVQIKIKTFKGNIKFLDNYIKARFTEEGDLIDIIGFLQDVTERVNYQKDLEDLSEDRKILLQEVHHRVKNNLQIILSFLSLESRFNKDNPEYVVEQTRNRIETMALTHEEVYNSNDLSNINLNTFITRAMDNLFSLYAPENIEINLNIENVMLDMDKCIPLSLLINEFALNTIKYAFPNTVDNKFFIDLSSNNEIITIKMWDNGIGLPENVNIFSSESLGFTIIRNLSRQLEAELNVLSDVEGFGLEITFQK